MERKDLCRFCQKQFKPIVPFIPGSPREYLCPDCVDMLTRFVRQEVLNALIDLDLVASSKMKGGTGK